MQHLLCTYDGTLRCRHRVPKATKLYLSRARDYGVRTRDALRRGFQDFLRSTLILSRRPPISFSIMFLKETQERQQKPLAGLMRMFTIPGIIDLLCPFMGLYKATFIRYDIYNTVQNYMSLKTLLPTRGPHTKWTSSKCCHSIALGDQEEISRRVKCGEKEKTIM